MTVMTWDRRQREGFACLVAFIGSVPVANWMVGNVGTVCVAHGPCLIPVAPNIMAPSGVLMIGIALVLRDLMLVVASASAFLLSEFTDFAVYTPLQKRRLILAVVASGAVGLVVDSIVFLYLAFGSLDYIPGQIIGKSWMVLLAIPAIWWLRERDKRLGLAPV
jgi:hypothetical protein